jgi:hypothetical protein
MRIFPDEFRTGGKRRMKKENISFSRLKMLLLRRKTLIGTLKYC